MHDSTWSAGQVLAWVGWAIVVVLQALAWALLPVDEVPMMVSTGLFAGSCAFSAVAAVLQLRCYMTRVCRLLRLIGGLEPAEPRIPTQGPELHRVR